jgi:hypothetical protein
MPPVIQPRRPRSFAGPVVLILIGVLFMLRNFNMVSTAVLAHWFARYWPVLIIIWGLIKLYEYNQSQRAGYPSRGIGVGGVFLLIFLIFLGLAASESEKVNWSQLGNDIDVDDQVFTVFGHPYNFSNDYEQAFPSGVETVHVVSDRGDITINTWDEPRIKVSVTKSVGASSQSDAADVDKQTAPQITANGITITVNANTGGAGDKPVRSNLEIFIPKKASLDIASKRGDVVVHQRQGDVKVSSNRGDVSVDDIAGNVNLSLRRGSVTAAKVTGDLSVAGRVNETTVSEVSGAVRLDGDFFEGMNLSKIGKSVTFKSSRTDLDFAKLNDMQMESDSLQASGTAGPTRITTRAKNVRLDDVSGDLRIENSNGEVEIHAHQGTLGNIQVDNRHGRVLITVPAKASFQLDARTTHGDIETDFDSLKVNSADNESRATGTVGAGGPTIRINTDHADIEIRKAG